MRTTPAQVHALMNILKESFKVEIDVWTNSPGDGVKRYHFTVRGKKGTFTQNCMGSTEAYTFLRGILAAKEAA